MPTEEATEDQRSAPPPPGSMVPWRFSSRCFCCCCEAYLVCAPRECHPRGQLTAEKGDRNLSCFASMQLEWTRGQQAFSMAVSSSSLRAPDDQPGKVLNQSWQQVEAGGDLIYYQPHVSKVHPVARGLLEAAALPLLTPPPTHTLPSSLSRAAAKLGFSRERHVAMRVSARGKQTLPSSGPGWGGAETISQIFLGDAFESVSMDKPSCILSVRVRCGEASLVPPALPLLQLQSLLELEAS